MELLMAKWLHNLYLVHLTFQHNLRRNIHHQQEFWLMFSIDLNESLNQWNSYIPLVPLASQPTKTHAPNVSSAVVLSSPKLMTPVHSLDIYFEWYNDSSKEINLQIILFFLATIVLHFLSTIVLYFLATISIVLSL